jgi:hypothetical protein
LHKLRIGVLTAGIVLAATVPCRADLLGSSVTGTLTFGTGTTNYYDPAKPYVPAGYLNHAGPTVTIGGLAPDFGFADTYDTITANFTGNSLTITDSGLSGAGWTQTFTDTAFAGATFVITADNFANGGLQSSLVGDVLTVTWAGTAGDPGSTGGFSYTPGTVPEPASWVMLLFALAVCSLAAFRLKKASA